VFLEGPHLLLLIYINTTGMMNLKTTQLNPNGKRIPNPAHTLIPIPQRQTVILSMYDRASFNQVNNRTNRCNNN
jgi:hypothetical protein